jgi:DNA-binding response OmpR family regulator
MATHVTFGVFEFDRETGELWRSGRPVRLQRQPALMLAALVAQPGARHQGDAASGDLGHRYDVDFERGLNSAA